MGFKLTGGGGGGGSGIPPSSFTAKGQLLIATGNGTFTEHAVPATAEQTLIADPTTGDGWTSDFPLDRGEAYARPTAALAETFSRRNQLANITGVLTSGTLHLVALPGLARNKTVSSITFCSGTTAVSVPTHQWYCLLDNALNVLGVTVDDTTNAWNNTALKTLNLTAQFVTTYSGLYYLGICVTATSPPTLTGFLDSSSVVNAFAPAMAGDSTAGLTDPASLGAAAGAISGSSHRKPWAYVS